MTAKQQQLYSHEAEQAFLGSCMIDPTVLLQYPLDPDDFFLHIHQRVYRAMLVVHRETEHLDPILVSEKVGDIKLSELLGYIGTVISVMHAQDYAVEIQKFAERREMVAIAQQIVKEAYQDDIDPTRYIEKITSAIRSMKDTDTLEAVAEQYRDYIAEREANPALVWGIPAPWNNYNKITGGIHKGESTLIYGDPGLGKSVIVGQIGFGAADKGYTVDWYSLEMSSQQLLARLVSLKSNVGTDVIHRGKLSPEERVKVLRAVEYVEKLPICISDNTSWTSAEIRADQQKKSRRADMVIVDYLGILKDKAESSHEKVEKASMVLRDMAKDLNQAVIVVSSIVKDGSIKGTKEVEHAQDVTWKIERPGDETDKVRKLIPKKLRHHSEFSYVSLKLVDDLPMMQEWKL